ncbi:2-hydroxyisoflavanone dehydratase-like [Bidens hawaiensis]|uniref:2-hydroxyisoflavanone dehydratase-like n=1 Tax=Bidens hawaiensis TaxID=980011 RepID=UPI00404AD06A
MALEQENDVTTELLPFLRVHKNSTVERLYIPELAPAETNCGVESKDTIISPEVFARLYLPNTTTTKLPILVYFHGGAFCIESAFSILCHRYINTISSQANVIVISVDYRLAPEHPLPAAYEDSWTALQWVATHSIKGHNNEKHEPWLTQHGDFNRLYIGGDSAVANISHHLAMRAGTEELHSGVKILGAFLCHPHFWGSKPLGSEPVTSRETSLLYRTWMLVYPSAKEGIDNPNINPFAKTAPCLAGLACKRLFVSVASEDELRDRGVRYYKAVKESEWEGELSMFEVEGEGHGFHIFNPDTVNAKEMFKRLAGFLQDY